MQGPWFIDPSWVPRQPHAPTEIKLSFSVQGTVRPLTRAPSSILNDFGLITRNRQAQFASSSNWEVSDMTAEYRDGLLARLVEFEISVESIAPVQVMAMQHLNVDEREQLISVLDQQPGYAGAVALLEALHRA